MWETVEAIPGGCAGKLTDVIIRKSAGLSMVTSKYCPSAEKCTTHSDYRLNFQSSINRMATTHPIGGALKSKLHSFIPPQMDIRVF